MSKKKDDAKFLREQIKQGEGFIEAAKEQMREDFPKDKEGIQKANKALETVKELKKHVDKKTETLPKEKKN